MTSVDLIQKVTSELSQELLAELPAYEADVQYLPIPHAHALSPDAPVWHVRLDLAFDAQKRHALEVNAEVALGRGHEIPDIIDLYGGDQLGVSRRHALLRPTQHELFIIDLGSTNGTWLNGRSIGVNIPYSLNNGDHLRLGRLELMVYIENRSRITSSQLTLHPTRLIADSIVTQLDRHNALDQSAEIIKSLTGAHCVSTWLIDEHTGEVFLESRQDYIDRNATLRTMETYDLVMNVLKHSTAHYVTVAGEVMTTLNGNPVEMFIPLIIGGVTFGVLAAYKSGADEGFSKAQVELLDTASHMLALTLQNSRVYQSIRSALKHRTKMTTTLNYVFQNDLRQLSRQIEGYARILSESNVLNEDDADAAEQIWQLSTNMTQMVDQLIDVTSSIQEPSSDYTACDVVDLLKKVVEDVSRYAERQGVHVSYKLVGDPYLIYADGPRLYSSVFNLVSNSVNCSESGEVVSTALLFLENEIVIRIVDNGPAVPPDAIAQFQESDPEFGRSFYWRQGIGLTLAIIQAVVEGHRGKFTIHNIDDNTRSEYIIKLPSTLGTHSLHERKGAAE